jgi:hypothetical protein
MTASVSLYPNPTDGIFNIDIKGMDHANITIMNSVGSVVYSEKNITLDNSMKRVDLSGEAEGIYMMIIENNEQKMIQKIVIQ